MSAYTDRQLADLADYLRSVEFHEPDPHVACIADAGPGWCPSCDDTLSHLDDPDDPARVRLDAYRAATP